MKKLLAIMLVICALCLTVFVVSSCGGGDGNSSDGGSTNNGSTNDGNTNDGGTSTAVTYTVYVQDQTGLAIEGVTVQICLGGEGGLCLTPKTTDANGVAKFEFERLDKFAAKILSAPETCEKNDEYIDFAEGETELFITLNRKQTYTVTAKDLQGHTLAGIEVKLHDAKTNEVVQTVITEENGRAVMSVAIGEYYATAKHAYDNGAFSADYDEKIVFEKMPLLC